VNTRPAKIAHLTLEHYNQRAEEFWEGAHDHNVSQNIEALLRHIESEPPFTILDFGCGPGRDLKVFEVSQRAQSRWCYPRRTRGLARRP
jgi:hypothetical protein